MKLLIVEDETKIGDYLRQGLNEAGFVVDLTRNGLDGHHLAMTEDFIFPNTFKTLRKFSQFFAAEDTKPE